MTSPVSRAQSAPGRGIGVYPVGALADIRHVVLAIRYRVLHPTANMPTRADVRLITASAAASFRRSWRRRSYWNGYLAEPEWQDGPHWTICGHGWTRRRALRVLADHVLAHAAETRRAAPDRSVCTDKTKDD